MGVRARNHNVEGLSKIIYPVAYNAYTIPEHYGVLVII
jgi:hypothetical protein